jgi:hypothetical protein
MNLQEDPDVRAFFQSLENAGIPLPQDEEQLQAVCGPLVQILDYVDQVRSCWLGQLTDNFSHLETDVKLMTERFELMRSAFPCSTHRVSTSITQIREKYAEKLPTSAPALSTTGIS